MPDSTPGDPARSALFTDLYELTMAQAYDAEGMEQLAVFELLFREMPPERNYFIAAGLDDVLSFLENLRFHEADLDYLRRQRLFGEPFLDRLRKLRFTGDVFAMPEGTPVFPGEPILQVIAPLLEAQLVETFLINQVHFQTLIATKAARIVTAAAGRTVVDFGSRRAHGVDAALKVARATYLVGAAGTSLVLAGQRYGIPIFGTMAHSYIQAHDIEADAFAAFAKQYRETTLLVDTYDTLGGVRQVIELSRRLGDKFHVQAVRLDSGDIGALARQTRQLLDHAGLHQVRIFASSELDEYCIAKLVAAGAPIDGFGVGTRMVVSDDVPHIDMAYKLVEYASRGRVKLSTHKVVYPGRKQVFRRVERGVLVEDVVGRFDEQLPGEPLLVPVMREGKRLPAGQVSLEESRTCFQKQFTRLPSRLRVLDRAGAYPVCFSAALANALEAVRNDLHARV